MIIMYTKTIQRYIFHVSKMVLGIYKYYSSMMISTSIPIRKKNKMAVIWAWGISRPHRPGRDARSGEALAIRKALLQDAEAKTEFGGWTAGGWNCWYP